MIPPIVIDLELNEYLKGGFGGLIPIRGRERQKLIEKDHRKLHKEGINHIHSDGSFDNLGGQNYG